MGALELELGLGLGLGLGLAWAVRWPQHCSQQQGAVALLKEPTSGRSLWRPSCQPCPLRQLALSQNRGARQSPVTKLRIVKML